MATVTKVMGLNLANVTFSYNDLTMKLVSISYVNGHTEKKLVITMISPYNKVITVQPNTIQQTFNIPASVRPNYFMTVGKDTIQGIRWKATLGV